jgi:hypothetical protein
VVVLRSARGHGAAARYVDYIKHLALEMGTPSLALVSVCNTDVLWARFRFRVTESPELTAKLASYGSTAKYMVCRCND